MNIVMNSQSPSPYGNFSAFGVLQVNYPRLKRSTVLPLHSSSSITIIAPCVCMNTVWNPQSPFSCGNFSALIVLQVNYPRLPQNRLSTITIIAPRVWMNTVLNSKSPFSYGNFSPFGVLQVNYPHHKAYRPPSTQFENCYNNCPIHT
jgi:hypothetical protein